MWGSGNLEALRAAIGKDGYKEFWRREEPPKHRYIQIIGEDKKEKKLNNRNEDAAPKE
jgi:hypothetical protein